jgi:hypothetical protein
MIGHGRYDGTDLQNAITRFKVASHGGTAIDGSRVAQLLTDHGLSDVHPVPIPPGAPAITIGTR